MLQSAMWYPCRSKKNVSDDLIKKDVASNSIEIVTQHNKIAKFIGIFFSLYWSKNRWFTQISKIITQ